MKVYIIKYATRTAKGKEARRQFQVKANDDVDARGRGQDKLQKRKSFNRFSDYIYDVIEKVQCEE